jgi:hypothetical protein
VVLLDQDTRRSQQPATVVRKPQVLGPADVDVLDPAAFLRYPDAAPGEDLARRIGVELPLLFRFELEHGRRVGFTSDVMRRLHVRTEARVIDLIGRRCVLDLVKRRAQLAEKLEVVHQIGAVGHCYRVFRDRNRPKDGQRSPSNRPSGQSAGRPLMYSPSSGRRARGRQPARGRPRRPRTLSAGSRDRFLAGESAAVQASKVPLLWNLSTFASASHWVTTSASGAVECATIRSDKRRQRSLTSDSAPSGRERNGSRAGRCPARLTSPRRRPSR